MRDDITQWASNGRSKIRRAIVASWILAAVCLGASCGQREPATATMPKSVAATMTSTGGVNDQEPGVKSATRTDEEWKKSLTPEQYRVLREKGTERAFTGKYYASKAKGVYKCAACGEVLFTSDTKFDSGCGWPSFFSPLAKGKIVETVDTTAGMRRTEVTCAACGGHLGHVFEDAPDQPTGLRYCINSVSIELVPTDEADKK